MIPERIIFVSRGITVSVLGEEGERERERDNRKKLSNIEVGYIIYLKSPFIKFPLFRMLWNVTSHTQ